MNIKKRYKSVLSILSEWYPDAQTELHYQNPYQLIVAVILSAQCTDKRVNQVTPAFFEAFPDVKTLSQQSPETVFEYIKSISYPNNKAKHLVKMSKVLMDKYGGTIPKTYEELISLPGVGRKTANVILSVLYQQPAMAVDTHVFRVSNRIGLVAAKNVLQAEKQLTQHIPKRDIPKAHHWLILHGRYICTARKPKCQQCPITEFCKYYTDAQKSVKNEVNKKQ
ncbi:MAG: endonuclease III [Bacteroidia bacterium]|nr:endonuclease III [Bacteroidia bacterium]MDW8346517.1 endonuclease III [Bacteroidia bacterium]